MLLQVCTRFYSLFPREKGKVLHRELRVQASGADGSNTACVSGSKNKGDAAPIEVAFTVNFLCDIGSLVCLLERVESLSFVRAFLAFFGQHPLLFAKV